MKGIKARISISRESDICQIGQGWVSDWDILVLVYFVPQILEHIEHDNVYL